MPKKILIAVDAPGPAEFIKPVLPLLAEKAELSIVTVNTKAVAPFKILEKFNPFRADTEAAAETLYNKINPDLLVVGTSSLLLGPYSIDRFTELAARDKKKIIAFQDYWANHRWPMNFKILSKWPAIMVPDELAKKFLLEDGYSGEIILTGNPSFDKIRHTNKEKDREWLRKKFSIAEDDFIILWIGRGTPQAFQYEEPSFEFFADSLREIGNKNILLAVRPHPRDENPERYRKFTKDIRMLDTSDFPSSEELLPMADAVAGLPSTNHIFATYLRVPSITILLPESGRKMLEKISMNDFPPNSVGATIGIYKEDTKELGDIISKLKNNPAYRAELKQNQEKYFNLPAAPAAEKVAETILAYS